jgi:hypothetical protein
MAAAPYAVLLRAFNLAFILSLAFDPAGVARSWQRVHEDRVEYLISWPHQSVIGDRHRLDLDELVGIAENRYAQQRARRVVVAEGIADDLPGSHQIRTGARGDVHGRLGHQPAPAAPSAAARLAITR